MQQKRRIKVCQSLDLESPETSYSDIELMLLQYLYTCIRMCTVLQWTLGICTCLMDVDLTATFYSVLSVATCSNSRDRRTKVRLSFVF